MFLIPFQKSTFSHNIAFSREKYISSEAGEK